jgi:hypothetical protein
VGLCLLFHAIIGEGKHLEGERESGVHYNAHTPSLHMGYADTASGPYIFYIHLNHARLYVGSTHQNPPM